METPIIATIPAAVWARVRDREIVLAGFAAGPGLAGQKTERFDPPLPLAQGIAWLEQWRATYRRARLELVDGGRLVFSGPRFLRYEEPPWTGGPGEVGSGR